MAKRYTADVIEDVKKYAADNMGWTDLTREELDYITNDMDYFQGVDDDEYQDRLGDVLLMAALEVW